LDVLSSLPYTFSSAGILENEHREDSRELKDKIGGMGIMRG
jgi:hypothetical protein